MNKRRIAVIAGGFSGESVISRKSAITLMEHIDTTIFSPYLVILERNESSHALSFSVEIQEKIVPIDLNTFSFEWEGEKISFEYAYITIHGTPGEDGLLQGYLDIMGIPYNTGGVLCESITFNKYICNTFLSGKNVLVAKSILLRPSDFSMLKMHFSDFSFPVFVKPNKGGSSLATTKVLDFDALEPALNKVFAICPEAIVEEMIEGTEVTCGCIVLNHKKIMLPLTEVVVKGEDFFTWEAKYHGKSDEITPARIDDVKANEVKEITARVADLLETKGIIRVDYIITPEGKPFLLEVNTTPGMTNESFIPQQLRAAALPLKDVLTTVINENLS